jgi:hypothetical protein
MRVGMRRQANHQPNEGAFCSVPKASRKGECIMGFEVYAAISEVTEAIGKEGISKDRKNDQQGYKFRGIDQVFNALNPMLAKAKLCILPRMTQRWMEERPTKSGGVMFYVTVQAEFCFVSAKDGSDHVVVMYGEGMDTADKATNKAMSAAYKYCCMQTFCIPTEGVDDADATTPEPAPKQQTVAQARGPVAVKPDHTAEPDLRQTINDAAGRIQDKYQAAGVGPLFLQVLGREGYESISQIPADYKIAQRIIETLKVELAGAKKAQAENK